MAGTLVANTINTDTGLFSTQNAYSGIAKAWVQFVSGTSPSISNSFNISSITYNATGWYTINFTTAMPNTTYAPVATYAANSGVAYAGGGNLFYSTGSGSSVAPTTSSFYITFAGVVSGVYNPAYASIVVFGT